MNKRIVIEAKWINLFFNDLEEYIKAVVTDMQSDWVGDSIHLTELRKDFAEKLVNGGYSGE